MFRGPFFVALLVLAIAGCAKTHPADNVSLVAENDPRMNAAIDKARSTVGKFINALAAPKPGQTAFSVKMEFSNGPNREHMWLTPVTYDGKNFHGTVSNQPEMVKNVQMGQRIAVGPTEISDWMYIDNGKLVGGETLRALRAGMPPPERAEFDKSVPFVIAD